LLWQGKEEVGLVPYLRGCLIFESTRAVLRRRCVQVTKVVIQNVCPQSQKETEMAAVVGDKEGR